MARIAYVAGRYVAQSQARVSIDDRGYQFADAAYEVMAVEGGRMLNAALHLDRLGRSLAALSLPWPMPRRALAVVLGQVAARNRLRYGMLYLQVSRGVAPRDHAFPVPAGKPVLVVTAKAMKPVSAEALARGLTVITTDDQRWKRPDIKSICLLPNVLAKQEARQKGAYEAWQVDDRGQVTEGSSTNAWIVTQAGQVVTRDTDGTILGGITRHVLLGLIAAEGIALAVRPFTVAEAAGAAEAFLTSTTSRVMPVVAIDGTPVGAGVPGPVTLRLRALYEQALRAEGEDR